MTGPGRNPVRLHSRSARESVKSLEGRIEIRRLCAQDEFKEQLARDVRRGFMALPKTLPPKYFYDQRGSDLFERITALPEYYLTRAETAILERVADDIVGSLAPDEIVEIGSGSSRKTQLLLAAQKVKLDAHGT